MILKGSFINEIGDGDRVKAVFLVSERRLLTARNGKPYGKIILSDKTGDILGMVWDEAQEQVSIIAPGDVVGVRASAESYENRLQLRIEKITKLSDQEVDITSLVPSSSRDITSMVDEFEQACNSIKNLHLRLLIERIFARQGVREGFMKAPAAKGIHHNYIGGLLEHSLFILRAISALLPVYTHMGFNRDMLVVGAIVHDLGKIYEYTYTKIIDITPMGRLLGHIYLSANMVDQAASSIEGFPEELKLQLLHMVLGHHGQLEFGSPKLPMTKEAIFLHMLDDLDAKLTGICSIIDATPEEEPFSAFSSIYNRHLYTKRYRDEE
jgi:3'-5' exoribonuclease